MSGDNNLVFQKQILITVVKLSINGDDLDWSLSFSSLFSKIEHLF